DFSWEALPAQGLPSASNPAACGKCLPRCCSCLGRGKSSELGGTEGDAMIDIHCHILPGMDDGARTMEESLAMVESAIADGITHVVATPHASSEYSFDFARVRAARNELQSRIGDRLQVATGCDFHLNPENM